jgi:hypothetical protein
MISMRSLKTTKNAVSKYRPILQTEVQLHDFNNNNTIIIIIIIIIIIALYTVIKMLK